MTRGGPFWYTKRIHRALPKGITFTISKNLLGASFRALSIHGNETKMEVLIHSFCMIEENIKAVREVDLDSLKAKAKADPYVKEQAFNLDEIDQISKDFYGEGIEGSIYQIVNQLRFKIWRDI